MNESVPKRYIQYCSIKSKIYHFLLCSILMVSCQTTKNLNYSIILNNQQIEDDIAYLKSKLINVHYDINWEAKEDEIMSMLDRLSINNQKYTIEEFKLELSNILQSVDDGHTRVLGIDFKEITNNAENIRKQELELVILDSSTIYLRVPNFTFKSHFNKQLKILNEYRRNSSYKRIIIDLRKNQGGYLKDVSYFLRNVINENTDLCESFSIKAERGMLGNYNNWIYMLKEGLKRSGDYLERECKKVKIKSSNSFEKQYVLVDSTIISGAMLTTYHLKNNGFIVGGESPNSLFNTFGNPKLIRLPESKLYVQISTSRLILNDNYKNRQSDMLVCDFQIKNGSLEKILEQIELIEKDK